MSQEDLPSGATNAPASPHAEPSNSRDRRTEAARAWQQMQYRADPVDRQGADEWVTPEE